MLDNEINMQKRFNFENAEGILNEFTLYNRM